LGAVALLVTCEAALPSALAQGAPVSGVATLAPEIVTATRLPQPPDQAAATVRAFDRTDVQANPALALDGVLRGLPGFSLFRRSDSLTANPTAQGVSLRGLGPSGASRSLVLLDGVPLNDPFGGWVAWTKVPRTALAQIELVPGGGATAWGASALGGVVQVLSHEPAGPAAAATAFAGDFGTRGAEFAATHHGAGGAIDVATRAFSTDGFPLVAPERRGPVDVAAWSRHRWLTARWRQPLARPLTFAATVRGYEEKRGNGTPYQHNATREKFLSLALRRESAGAFGWNALTYAQDQSFASTFGSVNATRTAETPASDQFAVPATAFGAAWTGTWRHSTAARTSAGVDARLVRGETREHFTFAAGDYTRRRIAGGEQSVGGVFALHERPLAPGLRTTLGARLDRWRERDGLRRESDRATGVALRDERYPARDGNAFSPSAGFVWRPAEAWRLRASLQRAYRRPTLNELYRPFRVGANVTEANAALRTERVTSGETGAEYSAGTLKVGATAFWNELRDAVGNVTLVRGPGTFTGFGVIAAGGVGRQRLNLGHTRVRGLEFSARWPARRGLDLGAEALINDATIRAAGVPLVPVSGTAPGALEGRRLAQVPRRSAAVSATWAAPARLTVVARLRYLGRQFEDDENLLTLGAAAVTDLRLSRPLTRQLEIFVAAENVGHARLETGRSADGVVNTGTPRLLYGGLRGNW
jgi:outer membrane receptor protein involved in Fe transport